MLRVYRDQLVPQAPHFPREIEAGIDQYLAMLAAPLPASPAEEAEPGADALLPGAAEAEATIPTLSH